MPQIINQGANQRLEDNVNDQDLEIIKIPIDFYNENSQSKLVISKIQDVPKYSRIKNIDFIGFELLGSDSIQYLNC